MKRSFLIISKRYVSNSIQSHVRKSHAVEIFRSQFLKTSQSTQSISVNDLDDLVKFHRIRPSLLLPVIQALGMGLGLASRFTPAQAILISAVNSTTEQHLNDSIRALKGGDDEQEDIKETLKYHRDAFQTEESPDTRHDGPFSVSPQKLLGNILYQSLKVSQKL